MVSINTPSLEAARIEAHWHKKKDIAVVAGLTPRYVGMLLSGKAKNPTVSAIDRLYRATQQLKCGHSLFEQRHQEVLNACRNGEISKDDYNRLYNDIRQAHRDEYVRPLFSPFSDDMGVKRVGE